VTKNRAKFKNKRKNYIKESFYKNESELNSELKTGSEWVNIITNLKKKVFNMRYNSTFDKLKCSKNEKDLQ
jgi:hypothetical protein